MPAVKRKAANIELFCGESFTMLDSWTDQLVVRRSSSGTFSVIARKFCADTHDGKRKWLDWGAAGGIRSPAHSSKAVAEQAELLGIEVAVAELVEALAPVDWVAAAVIATLDGQQIPPLPDFDVILAQRSLRALGKVELGVDWGYSRQVVRLSFEAWIRILNGASTTIAAPYTYEGKRCSSWWRFCEGTSLRVQIDADGSGYATGDGWIGRIANIPAIAGPSIDGVDVAQLALSASSASR